jgi:phage terminase large subunit GpA-like protein
MPSEALARSFSETRWLPMIDDCPVLAKEKPDNTDKIKILEQHFRKMSLWFVGSNSPANLSRTKRSPRGGHFFKLFG